MSIHDLSDLLNESLEYKNEALQNFYHFNKSVYSV